VQKVLADGAYDRASCRQHLLKKGIQSCISPRRKGAQKIDLIKKHLKILQQKQPIVVML
jgi:IS5 family transposase